jgi:hypothetical protein
VNSSPWAITVAGPKYLVAGAISDNADSFYGYESDIGYTIYDNLSEPFSSSIPLAEYFTTLIVNDYSGANWTEAPAAGYTATNSAFTDVIQGQAVSPPPYPYPQSPQTPLSGTAVDHWGQEWRVGSTTPGLGARVQTNTLQKYIDHARHTGIVSPAP